MSTETGDERYTVEIKIVRRVRVFATDELQAEREAFAKLSQKDQDAASDIRVLECGENFYPINREWVQPS